MNGSKLKQLQKQFDKYKCDKCASIKQEMDRYVQSSPIINFYMGTGKDQSHRTIRDVLNFSDSELEETHDYIQWLFPTSIRSDYNRYAPVLTLEERRRFARNDVCKKNMVKSLDVMLRFYGLERNRTVIRMDPVVFRDRSKIWLRRRNHNFYRLSRIVRSLGELGMKDFSKALYHCLTREIYPRFKNVIGDLVKHWKLSFISGNKHE